MDARHEEINRMDVSTFNRWLSVSYALRESGQFRFHIKSERIDATTPMSVNLWLTEDELDQFIVNLIEAKVKHGLK